MKFDPWSDWTEHGKPTKVKNLTNASTIFGALIFLSGTASGKHVALHIMSTGTGYPVLGVTRYLCNTLRNIITFVVTK